MKKALYNDSDIAIIGISGRFPQADNIDEFWLNIINSKESILDFPESRIKELEKISEQSFKDCYMKAGYLKNVTLFEPEIFSINSEEAKYIDPQNKLTLELVEETILDSGYKPESLSGCNIGVFLSENEINYIERFGNNTPLEITNSIHAMNAGRVAYIYNFIGPALSINTACSSSLTAVHYACKSLIQNDCDFALCGGVEISMIPHKKMGLENNAILSKDQKVRAFDEKANGTVPGEGGAIIFLKLLKKAIQDNDNIHCVIKASAVNSNGCRSNGIVAPSSLGQEDVIIKAISDAKLAIPISYIETHGTGTKIGDPIEFQGLTSSFKKLGYVNHSIPIGSLKTNIGHLNGASGIVGLVKAVLILKNKLIPPSLNFEEPNKLIEINSSPVYVNNKLKMLTDAVNAVGVSSFGLIGTNCHVVLQSYISKNKEAEKSEGKFIAIISARTKKSLLSLCQKHLTYLEKVENPCLDNFCYVLNNGRRYLDYKITFFFNNKSELLDLMKKALNNIISDHYHVTYSNETNSKLLFIIPDISGFDFNPNNELFDIKTYYSFYCDFTQQLDNIKEEYRIYLASIIAYCHLLRKMGLLPKAIIGIGTGEIITDYILGNKSIDELKSLILSHTQFEEFAEVNLKNKEAKLDSIIKDIGISHVILLFTPTQHLNLSVNNYIYVNSEYYTFFKLIAALVKNNIEIDWTWYFMNKTRMSIPTYEFDRKQYYPKINLKKRILEEVIEEEYQILTLSTFIEIIKKISILKDIEKDTNLLELCLVSIEIMQCREILKNTYDIDIPLSLFYEDITIDKLYKEICKLHINTSDRHNRIIRVKEAEYYPLSSAQNRMYILQTLLPTNTAYNINLSTEIKGDINVDRLISSIESLVGRHESLRTYFELIDGEPIQRISPEIKLLFETGKIQRDEIGKTINRFSRPFVLETPPLFRVGLFELTETNYLFLIDIHHLISDGSSLAIMMNDCVKLYNGEQLDTLNLRYVDFASWQNTFLSTSRINSTKKFWLNKFEGEIPILNLATDFIRPKIRTSRGGMVRHIINKDMTERINKFCSQNNVSLYMYLLSIYNILLSKYSNQEDIVIGTPTSGRHIPNISNIVGMFVNTLPLRNYPKNDLTYSDFLMNIKESVLTAFENQDYPFDLLVSDLKVERDLGRNPIFDTMFALQNISINTSESGFEIVQYFDDNKTAIFDLSLFAKEYTNEIGLHFQYSTDLFMQDTIERMLIHFENLIEFSLNNPSCLLSNMTFLNSIERDKILDEFNNNDYVISEDISIIKRFDRSVIENPNSIAIIDGNCILSYMDFNDKISQIAAKVKPVITTPNELIGILFDRSIDMIATIYALQKIGCPYLPIDPNYPEKRINYLLKDSKVKLLITDKKESIKYSNTCSIFNILTEENCDKADIITSATFECVKFDDISYVMYTSGTSGHPKGTIIKYQSLCNVLSALERMFPVTSGDTYLFKTNYTFDVSLTEIYGWIYNGGKLVILPKEYEKDAFLILDEIYNNKITHINFVPSMFKLFLNCIDKNNKYKLSSLKYIFLAGEAVTTNILKAFYNLKIAVNLINLYGPTENTIYSSFYIFNPNFDYNLNVPIGKALNNIKLYIVDKNCHIQPIGVPGELCISGMGLADGYLNNKTLTNEKFINNPFIDGQKLYKTGDLCRWNKSGEVEYLGRIDRQVKIRGFRIELNEIERVLLGHKSIRDALVTVKSRTGYDNFLCAYIIADDDFSNNEIRNYLLGELPSYMIPSFFIPIKFIPLNNNGKIDYSKLPEYDSNVSMDTEYVSPTNEIEKIMAVIWEEILGVNNIGITNSFFNLGGDSLLVLKFLSKAIPYRWTKLSAQDVFRYPTIKELAKKVKGEIDNRGGDYNIGVNNAIIANTNYSKKDTYNNIFLLGATGFLGIHILEQLILETDSNIYCLIRSNDQQDINTKFIDKLDYYFNGSYKDFIGKRVFLVNGDLTSENLGLSQNVFTRLTNDIDLIINSAGKVDYFGNYEIFETINVTALEKIINIAMNMNIELFHISTLSVAGGSSKRAEDVLFDESTLFVDQNYFSLPYVNSKFNAEVLINRSIKKGLKAVILRVGNLTARFSDGLFQENMTNNAFYNGLKSWIKFGYVQKEMYDSLELEFTPVDYCAQAIVRIIQSKTIEKKVIHLYNPNVIKIAEIIPVVKEFGINIKIIEEAEFDKLMTIASEGDMEIDDMMGFPIFFHIDISEDYKNKVIVDSLYSENFLKKLKFNWPMIDGKYLHRLFKYIRLRKFI